MYIPPVTPGRREAANRAYAATHVPYRATVAGGFVTGLLSGLAARGLDRTGPLANAGIDSGVLSDPRARVPLAAYAALYDAVIDAHGDEAFCLFETPLRSGSFEFLCRSVVGATRLEVALERAARFLGLVLPELQVSLWRGAGTAELLISEVRPGRHFPADRADPCRVFSFEWLLRLLHALACWLVARELPFESVRFPYPRPAHAGDYALIYTARSSFGGDGLRATLRADLLDLPIHRDSAALDTFLAGGPGRITTLYRRDRRAVQQVREVLAAALPAARSLGQTAHQLALSPRTLHRRLQEESASFREVKDALRRDLALSRLTLPSQSIAGIAADLGYAEPSAFFRAFHRWTGEAPTSYRRRMRARAQTA